MNAPAAYGFLTGGRLKRLVIPLCPLCGKKHVHGIPPNLDDVLRYGHCGWGEDGTPPGSYRLVVCENRAEAVRRAREGLRR